MIFQPSKRHAGRRVFKNTLFIEFLLAIASKYNVTLKELFSLPHRIFKKKYCLNMLSVLNLPLFVEIVF